MRDIFKWEYVGYFFPRLLEALPVTLMIVIIASLIGTILGLIIALTRVEKVPVLSPIFAIIVSFLRGTPIYVQLFIVYFGIPVLSQLVGINGLQIDRMAAVYVAYGLNVGAFFSEIFRSSILSVPRAQIEAAYSVGLNKWQSYRRVILPQAIRIAIPSYGTTIIGLLQDTSIAFTLGVVDVMGKIKAVSAVIYRSLEGYFVAAVIFIVLSIILEYLFRWLNHRFSFSRKKIDATAGKEPTV